MEPMTRELGVGPPDPTAEAKPTRALGSAALVSGAFLATNALAYVFTVLAARVLLPAAYGELAALLGVLLVGTVPATGVQTAAALHLGGRRGSRTDIARLHAAAVLVGLGVVVVGVLSIAPLRSALHLRGTGALAWLAVLLLPHTLISGYQGLLQGARRYRRLVAITFAFGALKLAGGTVGLLLGRSSTTTLTGLTAGALAGAFVGWLAGGRPGLAGDVRRPVLLSLRASGALLGFVVLLNLDLLLARHHLPPALAGEYAVASILTKVAFWLPQGVGVVILPRLGNPDHRRRLLPVSLALVGGTGALLTLGTAAVGASVLPLIGGASYAGSIGSATWLFAALGTMFAVAQLLLFSGIASADRLAGAAVWTAAVAELLAVEVLAASGRPTLLTIVVPALGAGSVLVGTGLLRMQGTSRSPALRARMP